MTRVLACCFLAGFAASAHADDWSLVTKSPGVGVYVDGRSIKPQGDRVNAWVRMDYDADQELKLNPPKKFRSMKHLYVVDCRNRQFTIAQAEWHSASGELTHKQTTDRRLTALDDAQPGTVAAAIIDRVCVAARSPRA
jgi:hypothetical protein